MSKWDYAFGVDLPKNIQEKMEHNDLLRNTHPNAAFPGFEKDAFSSDGFPVAANEDTVYPCFLHKIIGIPVPENIDQIPADYRCRASQAAMKWLEKILGCHQSRWSFNGLRFCYTSGDTSLNFCFPDTSIVAARNGASLEKSAVLTFPDAWSNDEDWEYGMIPQYAESQAQLLMWCFQQFADRNMGFTETDTAYLVRITGNLSVDNTVRTVSYDARKAEQIIAKIIRAARAAQAKGCSLLSNSVKIPKFDWKEAKTLEIENAYHIDDPDFYDLVARYMQARSIRKSLEVKAEAIKAEKDSIAFALASSIKDGFRSGTAEENDLVYMVTHTPKRKNEPTISASLVRQLAPQYEAHIRSATIPRGRITIEAL